MRKTILITGSTDGIGLETAKMFAAMGHHVLLHGRNIVKLENAERALIALPGAGPVDSYLADLSIAANVEAFADIIGQRHARLDVLINNAGIYNAAAPVTRDGLDIRFAVNTIAPYHLTRRLLPLLGRSGRVINLSSAAQASVNLKALAGREPVSDSPAYAQSKLALTHWSMGLGRSLNGAGPSIIAVNPGSYLGSKMVKQAYGVAGNDIRIGANILVRAALADEFEQASGRYFDNDSATFSLPHPDAQDPQKTHDVMCAIDAVLSTKLN